MILGGFGERKHALPENFEKFHAAVVVLFEQLLR